MLQHKNVTLEWLGHDCFRMKCGKVLYFDPYKIEEQSEKADIVLITHTHYDHFSLEDLKKVITPQTVLIVTPDCVSKVSYLGNKFVIAQWGQKLVSDGIEVTVVPAYNLDKEFHPKINEWVGYVVTVDGTSVYHMGDTDNIPELATGVDIALVPVSGTYVMNAQEAAQAMQKVKPKIAVPMHYGTIVGSRDDALQFKQLAPCPVHVFD